MAVHSDPRLAILVKKNQAISKHGQPQTNTPKNSKQKNINEGQPKVGNSGTGFRVQIYNGTDRGKALKIRDGFDKAYPGVHSYISFKSPYYRIRVGNYINKSDANGMFKEASSSYFPCIIVPDKIKNITK